LLLQGEQVSDLHWNGSTWVPISDTSPTINGGKLVRSSFLALLDSSGSLRAFRRLSDLANAGAWKIRRIPGKGWLVLTVDQQDILEWSRLYLLDDSLNLLESSDTLPMAQDVELAKDGHILVSGMAHDLDSTAHWISGTGSMWTASCRLGQPTTRITSGNHPSQVAHIHQTGSILGFDLPAGESAFFEVLDPTGVTRFHGRIDATTRLELPRGISLCRLRDGQSMETARYVR
jgi:hypothetical protein